MALTLVLGKLSPEATKGLLAQGLAAREKYFRGLVEPTGMKVHGYYFAEGGEWDVVVLVETNEDAAGSSVAATFSVQATGMYTSLSGDPTLRPRRCRYSARQCHSAACTGCGEGM